MQFWLPFTPQFCFHGSSNDFDYLIRQNKIELLTDSTHNYNPTQLKSHHELKISDCIRDIFIQNKNIKATVLSVSLELIFTVKTHFYHQDFINSFLSQIIIRK